MTKQKFEYKQLTKQDLTGTPGATTSEVEVALNIMGADGWQLISENAFGGEYTFTFMR